MAKYSSIEITNIILEYKQEVLELYEKRKEMYDKHHDTSDMNFLISYGGELDCIDELLHRIKKAHKY